MVAEKPDVVKPNPVVAKADESYCSLHPFDKRCIKGIARNAEGFLEVIVDTSSPYYNEQSMKCLRGVKGLDWVLEAKAEKTDGA